MGTTSAGFLSASIGAIATKAAAGLAAAALVTAGAVEVEQPARPHVHRHAAGHTSQVASVSSPAAVPETVTRAALVSPRIEQPAAVTHHKPAATKPKAANAHKPALKTDAKHNGATTKSATKTRTSPAVPAGRTQTQTDSTVLAGSTTPVATTTPSTTGSGLPGDEL